MKKNSSLRVAALLLALTLITSCFVGGTFAKYTTSVGDTATARAARWGFNANGNSIVLDNLFSAAYKNNKVKAANGTDLIIAPGTNGMAHFKFEYDNANGTNGNVPEVAYNFTVDTTGSACSIPDGVVRWSLNGDWYDTFDELLAAIKWLSGSPTGTQVYAANTLPNAFNGSNQHNIYWSWAFDDTNNPGANDASDTAQGIDLNGVTIKITITATQIN